MPRHLLNATPQTPDRPATSSPTLATRRFALISGRVVEWGLYILIVFTPLAFGTVEPWSIALAEVIIFTIALAWGLKMVTSAEIRIERTPFNPCWLLVLGLGVVQVIPLPPEVIQRLSPNAYALYREAELAADLAPSWRTLSLYPYATKQEWLRLFALALVFWVAANQLQTRAQVERVVRLILIMGFSLAVFGMIQHFAGNGKIYWVRTLRHGTPFFFGPYVNRNHFSGYMEMVIPLALGYFLATRRTSPGSVLGWRDRLLRWATPEASRSLLTYFCGLMMVAALLLAGSRAGLLSFLGSMLFIGFLMLMSVRQTRGAAWVIGLGLFIATGFGYAFWVKAEKALDPLAILWLGSAHPAARGRLFVWEDVWRLGLDYRWTGAGLDTFSWVFPIYKRPGVFEKLYTHAESDYLQAFAEGGLALVAILALALVWGGGQLLFAWFKGAWSYERRLGLGALGGLFALLLHSAGDFNLHITANAILFVLLLALSARLLTFGFVHERHGEPPSTNPLKLRPSGDSRSCG